MDSNRLVTIIINNYNYGDFLSRAIDSCLQQSYPHIEVIVVDDGSTDQSPDIIQSYGPKIRPIFQSNGGQASTLNTGFEKSQGDIIACLDADDYFLPSKIAEVVAIYETHPEIGWCFNAIRMIDSHTETTIGYSIESQSKWCDFRKGLRNGALPFYIPAASGLTFRRETLEQVLPMPEKIGMYDRYISWYSLLLSPGFFLDKPLTVRLVHDRNFTQVSTKEDAKGVGEYGNTKAVVSSALYLRKKRPEIAQFCNRKLAIGYGLNWWTNYDDTDNAPFVQEYLSQANWLEKIQIYMMALYYSRPWRKHLTFRSEL